MSARESRVIKALNKPLKAPCCRRIEPEPAKDMSDLTITEMESAINYWRGRSPSVGDELRLCPEASALSRPYARMIVEQRSRLAVSELDGAAQQAWSAYLDACG
jgi:hypothetical protein